MGGEMVNKLVVDRDDYHSPKRKTVTFLKYTGDQLAQRDIRKLVEVVYRNFEEIADKPLLKHNRREIARVLTSPQSIIIFGVINGVIVAYLIAEAIVDNLRQLLQIVYLYTVPMYRNRGLATFMLNLIQQYAEELDIPYLSLTFDTYNKKLLKFYTEYHFDFDSNLRSYQRYDMLVKPV